MSLILSGTDGLSDVDGTAATPAIRGTDANTGIFFPAADTIAFSEGGAEVMRIDSSGNLGIGTASPSNKLVVSNAGAAGIELSISGTATLLSYNRSTSVYTDFGFNAQTLLFNTGSGGSSSERMRIDSSGNVGIGTSSPTQLLTLSNGATPRLSIKDTRASVDMQVLADNVAGYSGTVTNYPYIFVTNNAERMRIDSSGNLLVGTTNSSLTAGVGVKFVAGATEPYLSYVINTAAGASNFHLYNTNATNNGYRFFVTANGGIQNYSGNNVNLSDERIKTNIELSGNYLEKICAIPVKLFNYRDEPENEQRTLGVIAQDVEAVAPEFVNNDGWKGTDPEDGVPLKTVYTTDITFALMKCIQEQQALIQSLTTRITALETP
jgi:hypothetical protein